MTFGKFIRQLRQEYDITQDHAALALGYKHRSNIHKLETDKLEWKLSSVVAIAHLFGMNPSELLARFEENAL